MQKKEKNGLSWLEFDLLQNHPHLVHGVFLRQNELSEESFSSLDLGASQKNSPKKIIENRKKSAQALGLTHLAFSNSVHGNDVVMITSTFPPLCSFDGMISQQKEIGLAITHADCQAILLYDPHTKWFANLHVGWKGLVNRIIGVAIDQLKKKSVDPSHLLACVSPSLGPEASEFINYKDEFPKEFWKYQWRPYYFNLWEIAKDQLREQGIPDSQIEVASLCTYSNPDEFFSYRRDLTFERNATIIGLIK